MSRHKRRKNPSGSLLWGGGLIAAAVAYFVWWKPRQEQKAELLNLLKATEEAIASNTGGKEKALELQAIRSELLKKLQQLHLF